MADLVIKSLRQKTRKMHPKKLLEEDAQEAFQVMHIVFGALLRPVSS